LLATAFLSLRLNVVLCSPSDRVRLPLDKSLVKVSSSGVS
jgi:hypothetical protein